MIQRGKLAEDASKPLLVIATDAFDLDERLQFSCPFATWFLLAGGGIHTTVTSYFDAALGFAL